MPFLAAFEVVAPEMFAADAFTADAAAQLAAEEAARLAAEEAARLAAEETARQAALETAQQTAQEQAVRQTAEETARQTALEGAQQTAQEQAVRQTAEEGIKQASPTIDLTNTGNDFADKTYDIHQDMANSNFQGPDLQSSTYQAPEALKGTAQIDPNMVRPPPTAGDINLSGLNSVPETNPFMKGLDSAWDWVKNNKMMAASLGMNAMNLMNKRQSGMGSPEPYNGILTKYKMSPDFQGRQANPQDFQYTPKQYAEGGIMGYRSGGIAEGDMSSFNYYKDMLERKPAAAPERSDVGIYYDQDPDTRYQDALTAAQIRQAKVNRRANMQLPGMKRPTPMGQLNLTPPGTKATAAGSSLDPENAAQGGIMYARRYADGGVTGSGGLDLHVPLNLGENGGAGGYTPAGGNIAYQKQDNSGVQLGGFNGNNNSPQEVDQKVLDQYNAARLGQPGNGPQQTPMQDPAAVYTAFQNQQAAVNANQPLLGSTQPLGGGLGNAGPGYVQGTSYTGKDDPTSSDTFQSNRPRGFGGIGSLVSGLQNFNKGMASGGITSLGGYAAGGNPRLLRGPGDGMSDNIPATIAGRQPARLADGEFVIPADVVSHLGNGSTEAGAKKLHDMMTNIRKARTGNPKQGKQINPNKFLPK